ncbi:hypothetical protein DFH09DRAFT_1316887 [Mycena vulgaris]|nr:hypothetical protein DFH09DRAFT_1316887 [Mycena vulgaris]
MNLSPAIFDPDPTPRVHAELLPGSPEPPLYFSRQRYHHGYDPDVVLGTLEPSSAIETAVLRFWQKHDSEEGADCLPTFSAAPQSEYYGYAILAGGQRAHHSIDMNNFKIYQNPKTGKAFSVQGHTLSITLELPTNPYEPWFYEMPFPTSAQLREAMLAMAPHDPPAEGETGFPLHTTTLEPPLLTFQQRLRAVLVRQPASVREAWAHILKPENRTVRPGDFQRSQSGSSSDKPSFGSGEEGTSSTTAPSGSTNATLVEALYEDIRKRTDIALRTQQFFKDNGIKFRDDEEEDVPPLLSEFSDTVSSISGDPDLCPVCFQPEHPPIDCPLATLPMSAPVSAPEERPVPEDKIPPVLTGTFRYVDDITYDLELMEEQAELDYERILHDVLEVAMVPSLREIVTLTGPQMEKYFRLLKSARAVRRGFRELAAGIDVQSDRARNEFVEQFVEEMARDIEEALKEAPEPSGNDPDIATDASVDASIFRPSGPIASHLARISHPRFNPRKGNPITGSWSSSSDSSSGSSEYEPLFRPVDFATGVPQDQHRLTEDHLYQQSQITAASVDERSSPAVTEWVLAQAPDRAEPPESVTDGTSHQTQTSSDDDALGGNDTSSSINTTEFLDTVAVNTNQPNHIQFGDATSSEERAILHRWVHDGKEHQEEHFLHENLMGGAPIRHAFEVLYGPLREFVEFPSMSSDSSDRLEALSALSVDLNSLPRVDSPMPDPTQSPTSLDFSLPSAASSVRTENATGVEVDEPAAVATSEAEVEQNGKRKVPDGERLGEFQEGPRKRFPIHLASPEVIRQFAGVRLALVEGQRRIESTVWHRYGIEETDFPTSYERHPLLFDVEAAKMHATYNVLFKHKRFEMAALLHDALHIRLRNDYAISHLLNAGQLEAQYPGAYLRYWELLPYPAHGYYHESDDESDSDESYDYDSEMEGLELRYPDTDPEMSDHEARSVISADNTQEEDAISMHGGPDNTEDIMYIRRVHDWEHTASNTWADDSASGDI